VDTGDDQGNFAGVAIYVDGEEVVLGRDAGWHRLRHEIRRKRSPS
jgi:hypothetical protein